MRNLAHGGLAPGRFAMAFSHRHHSSLLTLPGHCGQDGVCCDEGGACARPALQGCLSSRCSDLPPGKGEVS